VCAILAVQSHKQAAEPTALVQMKGAFPFIDLFWKAGNAVNQDIQAEKALCLKHFSLLMFLNVVSLHFLEGPIVVLAAWQSSPSPAPAATA
jgi:hypothetical protein